MCYFKIFALEGSATGIAQGIQAAKGAPPEAARAPLSFQLAPPFHGGTVRLKPSIHKLPAAKHHSAREMGDPADQHLRPDPPFGGRGQTLSRFLR